MTFILLFRANFVFCEFLQVIVQKLVHYLQDTLYIYNNIIAGLFRRVKEWRSLGEACDHQWTTIAWWFHKQVTISINMKSTFRSKLTRYRGSGRRHGNIVLIRFKLDVNIQWQGFRVHRLWRQGYLLQFYCKYIWFNYTDILLVNLELELEFECCVLDKSKTQRWQLSCIGILTRIYVP